jgi:hypothetical protein
LRARPVAAPVGAAPLRALASEATERRHLGFDRVERRAASTSHRQLPPPAHLKLTPNVQQPFSQYLEPPQLLVPHSIPRV